MALLSLATQAALGRGDRQGAVGAGGQITILAAWSVVGRHHDQTAIATDEQQGSALFVAFDVDHLDLRGWRQAGERVLALRHLSQASAQTQHGQQGGSSSSPAQAAPMQALIGDHAVFDATASQSQIDQIVGGKAGLAVGAAGQMCEEGGIVGGLQGAVRDQRQQGLDLGAVQFFATRRAGAMAGHRSPPRISSSRCFRAARPRQSRTSTAWRLMPSRAAMAR